MGSQPIGVNSIPHPGNLNCMICLSDFLEDKNFNRDAEIVEILADIFKVISIHMKWTPPSKFQYKFGADVFPFCKDCRVLVAKLYKFDSLLLEIQKEIDTLALQISAKILQSQNDLDNVKPKEALNSAEISSKQNLADIMSGSGKSGYYRNSIRIRYFPSVRLISDPTLKVPERGVDDQDDSCHSDSNECQTRDNFQDDDQDAENISIKDDDDSGNHKETTVEWLNLVPFPSLRDRVKLVGKCQFLLDDKCLFECSKTRIKCVSCDILFGKKPTLKAHLSDCPGNPSDDVTETFKYLGRVYDKVQSGEFRCRRCMYLCLSPNLMCSHMRKFHGKKTALKDKIKPLCVELEPNKFVCNQKYPFELKDEKFICGTCLSDFSTRSKVLSHIQREHIWVNIKKMIVYENISPGKFVWTDPFNKKYSFERVGNMYKCDQCSYSALRDKTMKKHVRAVHIVGRLVCKICGKAFFLKDHLTSHLKRHTDDRPITCEFCGKSLKCLGSLRSHKAIAHLDIFDKKFKCEICGKLFGSPSLLTSHSKQHMNSVCHICGKNVRTLTLNSHILSHSEENLFECKTCGKKFRHSNSLYTHLKSHDGAKPYECDICCMKFTQHYSVTRHKNVVHNSKNTTKTYAKIQKRKRQEDLSSDEEEVEESSEEEQSEDETYSTRSSTDGTDET